MASDVERPFPENHIFKYGPFVVYVLILGILANELLGLNIISELEWLHIVLIAGLLVIPFIREIDQIFIPNVGGVQMNRTMEWKETMQKVLEEYEAVSPPESGDSGDAEEPPQDGEGSSEEGEEEGEGERPIITPTHGGLKRDSQNLGGSVDEISDEIYNLADDNPRLAIAKLGMELEHGLAHLIQTKGEKPHMQYHGMLEQLRDDPDIDSRFISIAEEIRQARNEAVHSAKFSSENTAGLIDVGLDLLRYINKSTKSEKIPEEGVQTQFSRG